MSERGDHNLNLILGEISLDPEYLSLSPPDKELVLTELTNQYIDFNGLDGEDARSAKVAANRYNEITSLERDRKAPDEAFLAKVFEGYDDTGSREDRLSQISGFRKKAADLAYEEDFVNANDIRFVTDLILDAEERKVRGEDTGYFGDITARTLEGFVVPLTSFFNAATGDSPEEVAEKARRLSTSTFEEKISFDDEGAVAPPRFDQQLASGLGSVGAGLTVAAASSMAGAAVSGGNPYVAGSFAIAGTLSFNANLRFQEGFSQELEASGNMERAVEAGFSAMPAAAIDSAADLFLIGKFGIGKFNRAIKATSDVNRKKALFTEALRYRRTKDIIGGFAFEGGTEVLGDVASAYGQIASTGRQELAPTGTELIDTFLVGGIIGGGIAGVGSTRTTQLIKGLSNDVSQYSKLVQEGKLEEAAQFIKDKNLTDRAGISAVPKQPNQSNNAQSQENNQEPESRQRRDGQEQVGTEESGSDQGSQQASLTPEEASPEQEGASPSQEQLQNQLKEQEDLLETYENRREELTARLEQAADNAAVREAAITEPIEHKPTEEDERHFWEVPGVETIFTTKKSAEEYIARDKARAREGLQSETSLSSPSTDQRILNNILIRIENTKARISSIKSQLQPINELTAKSEPAPKDPVFIEDNPRLHVGDDGSRVADGKLVRLEGDEVVTRGPRGAVINKQKLPPNSSPEAIDAFIAKVSQHIIDTGEPQAKRFNPDGVVKRSNVRKQQEEADLEASREEIGPDPTQDQDATEEASTEEQALATIVTEANKQTSRALRFKPRTQVETPVFGSLRAILPGISALARANPLAAQRLAEIAKNVNRSRNRSEEGPEFRELSEEQALELAEIQELSRQAYFNEKKAKFGEDMPQAFNDPNISIPELSRLINELSENDTTTPNAWRPLVEQHLEFVPNADQILPQEVSRRFKDMYNDAIEYMRSIDLDSLTPTETRNLFIGLDSIVTDRSPSMIFEGLASQEAENRVAAVAAGSGLFRKIGTKFFNAGRSFENILKQASASERGRAILRHITQPYENAENIYLSDARQFQEFFEDLVNRSLRPAMKKNKMASIRVGLVSDIVQAIDGQDPAESVRNTISKIRDSLEKLITPTRGRLETLIAVRETRKRIQAEKSMLELNSFLEGIDENSSTLYDDVAQKADEWLTDEEKTFLGEMRNWFAQRKEDVKFLTEAVIGRPFQGITNYMPHMLLGDGNAEINPNLPIDTSNMVSIKGMPVNSYMASQESGNLRNRSNTDAVPEGSFYVLDAIYKFSTAANAMLFDLATLPERKIVNKMFNEKNKAVLTDAMDKRAENVKALQDNFKIRAMDQLEAHKGVDAFTQVLGWGYRRLSGRVLSSAHQIFSQYISPLSHFVTLHPKYVTVIPKAMQLGWQGKFDPDSLGGKHIRERVPTLHNRNFAGERAINQEARQPIQPAGFPGRAFQAFTGFLDQLNEKVLFKPMQWGDTLSADGIYFANLYRIVNQEGKVRTWAEFEDYLPNATNDEVRRAKIDTESNIAPSANNQRGYLGASREAKLTAIRMLFIPFTSHRLNAVNETWTAGRNLLFGGQGMTAAERAKEAQNMAAFAMQAASFAAVKFGIGYLMYMGVKKMMDFDEEDDDKIIDLQVELAEAKRVGDKDRELFLTAELQSLQNVRALIRNKDQKKLSGASLGHQILKDIVGNTLYVAVPDQLVNFTGFVIDQSRSEDFKNFKDEELQLINELIEQETDERELAKLKLQKRDIESLELLRTGHRPTDLLANLGTFGSVLEPLTFSIAEGYDSVFDEANEFSGNEALLALGIFGIGQADLTTMAKDLEKIQEERQKVNVKDRERREKALEEEINSNVSPGARLPSL